MLNGLCFPCHVQSRCLLPKTRLLNCNKDQTCSVNLKDAFSCSSVISRISFHFVSKVKREKISST